MNIVCVSCMKTLNIITISIRFLILAMIIPGFNSYGAKFRNPEFYKLESIWTSSTGQKFKLCRVSSNGALRIVKEKKIKVHFKEDVHELTPKSERRLKRFFKRLPKNTFNIKIAAHADSCGGREYNAKLAQRRGLSVYNFVKDLIPRGMPVTGENHGEEESGGHISHDRFVEVVAEYWIDNERFDQIVLFDISGSLHERKIGRTATRYTLDDLKRIKLKPGTIAYVPRDIRYACEGQELSSYNPVGEDFYWEAMTLITTSIRASAKKPVRGTTYTDDTDPRGRSKEVTFDRSNTGKVSWEIR